LQIDGATINSTNGASFGTASLQIGIGATSQAALILNSGAVTTSSEVWVGTRAGSYGALLINGGSLTANSFIAVSRSNDNFVGPTGVGILNVTGGVLNVNNYPLTLGALANNAGTLHSSFTATGGIINANETMIVGEYTNAVATLAGTALLNISGTSNYTGVLGLAISGGVGPPNNVSIFNLNGGTLTTTSVLKGSTSGTPKVTAILNFNGGLLRAMAATPNANSFVANLDKAYIYPRGAFIDDNGQAITIPQALLPPTGNGVDSITVSAGTGYFAPPLITITGGGGTGASAIANIDTFGNLTGISITNPGVGYTATPAISLFGGGGTLSSTSTTITLAPNSSGGLTKTGNGTLTLTATNTYTGPTNVNSGLLRVNGTLTNSLVSVNGGAALSGTGTIAGLVTLAAGATPATQGAIGPDLLSGTLT